MGTIGKTVARARRVKRKALEAFLEAILAGSVDGETDYQERREAMREERVGREQPVVRFQPGT